MNSILYHYHNPILVNKRTKQFMLDPTAAAFINQFSLKYKITMLAYSFPKNYRISYGSTKESQLSNLNRNIEVIFINEKPKKLVTRYSKFIFDFSLVSTIRRTKYDYLYIEYPTPLSLILLFIVRYRMLSIFLAGDIVTNIKTEKGISIKYLLAKINKIFFFKIASLKKVYYLGENMASLPSIKPRYDFFKIIKKERIPIMMNTYNKKDSLKRIAKLKLKNNFKNPLKLLSINRISSDIGVYSIPEIANLLILNKVDFIWYIIGDGPDKDDLKEILYKNNLTKYVVFLGWFSHKEIENFVNKNLPDLYVNLPTYCGGGPARSAWEALSFGIPALVGELDRKPYLNHLENIIYANANSPEDFANKIKEFSKLEIEQINKIKVNSAKIALKRSVDKEIERIHKVFSQRYI